MEKILDADALAALSVSERRKLLRMLVALEEEAAPAPGSSWRWDAILVFIVGSCIVLAAWIGVLAVTLPKFYHTGSWRGAWVGFDIALLATFAATLLNPFGFGIYGAVRDQFVAPQLEALAEWQPVPIDWTTLSHIFSLGNAAGGIMLVTVTAVALAAVALYRRRLGAAVILIGAAAAAPHHVRFEALLGIVTAIVGGEFVPLPKRLAAGAAIALVGAYCVVVTPRPFLGLSYEYPSGAVDFIAREHIPAQVLPTRFGAYFVWRLWPEYRDYWDARTIPFGQDGMARLDYLTSHPPDAPGWQREVEHYDINGVLAVRGPLGFRMNEFCASDQWAPVYLDKVSAVFVRRRPENEDLIKRLRIDCSEAQRRSGVMP